MDIKDVKKKANGGRDLYSTPDSGIRNAVIQDNPISRSLANSSAQFLDTPDIDVTPDDKKQTAINENRRVRYGVTGGDINELDEQYQRAVEQGVGEKFWNALKQIGVNEIAYGSIKAFGDIYDIVTHLRNPGDFTNPFSEHFEKLQEEFREKNPIYQKSYSPGFHFNDAGWIANGLVNVGSTVSLMVPGKAISGLSKLTRLSRINNGIIKGGVNALNAVSKGKLAKNIAGTTRKATEVGKSFSEALMSRMAEGYQEGRETYKLIFDDTKEQLDNMSDEEFNKFVYDHGDKFQGLTKDEIAAKIATEGGSKTYWNDYLMLLMDVPQMFAINKIFKQSANAPLTNSVERAQAQSISKLAGNDIGFTTGLFKPILTKEYWKAAGKLAKQTFTNPIKAWGALELGEGIEEGYQGIQSKRGQLLAEMYLNPYIHQNSILDYIADPEIQEQAFWGVMGGVGFKWSARGIDKGWKGISYLHEKSKLSKEQQDKYKYGDNQIRILDIQKRQEILDNFINKEKLLRDNKDYNDIETDSNGIPIIENGKPKYREITDKNLLNLRRRQNAEDSIRELVMSAAINGNLDLVKEFISNPQFKTYLQQNGINIDEILDSGLQQTVAETEEEFYKAKDDITKNAKDADNVYIIDIAAKKLAKARLLRKYYDSLEEDINTDIGLNTRNDEDYTSDINPEFVKIYKDSISQKINLLNASKESLKEQYKSDNYYSEAAYKDDIENINRKLSALYNEYARVDSDFLNIENIKPYLEENGIKVNDSTIDSIKNTFQNYINNRQQETTNADDTILDLFKEKSFIKIERLEQATELPENNNSKDRYQKYYDASAIRFTDIAKNKFGKALKTVQEYFEKAEDLDAALATLKNTNNQKLKKAYDILRFGSKDAEGFTAALKDEIDKEKNRRNKSKKDNETVISEDTVVTPTQSKNIREQVANAVASSTGVEQETTTTQNTPKQPEEPPEIRVAEKESSESLRLEDLGSHVLGDVESEQPIDKGLDEFNRNFDEFNRREKFGRGTYLKSDKEIIELARNTAATVVNNNRELWLEIIRGGINSEAYNTMISIISEQIEQNVYKDDPKVYAVQGLAVLLNSVKFADNTNANLFTNKEDRNKFIKLASDVLALTAKKKYNSDNSMFEDITDEEQKQAAKEILYSYINDRNLNSTNDKFEIDILDFFNYLTSLAENNEGIDYNAVVEFYVTFKDSVQSLVADEEFIFSNLQALDKNVNSFLDAIYQIKTKKDVLDEYMGASLSSSLNGSKPSTRQLIDRNIGKKVYYKNDEEFNSISIVTENGDELGYLAKVIPNKTNTGYSTKKDSILKTQNGYEYTYDNIIYYALNGNNIVWDYLKNFYITKNVYRYDSNTRSAATAFLKNNIANVIQDSVIKNYLPHDRIVYIKDQLNQNMDNRALGALNSQLEPILRLLFFELNSRAADKQSISINDLDTLRKSYENYKEKVFINYQHTHDIQNKINAGQTPSGILRGHNSMAIKYDRDERKDIIDIGLKDKIQKTPNDFPFAYVSGKKIVFENGKTAANRANFRDHTTAIVVQQSSNTDTIEDGTANLALLVEPNTVSETSPAIADAIYKYLEKAINDYYNIIKDKSSSASSKGSAFNELYNTFNDLFGNTTNKVFNKFYILSNESDSRDFIAICNRNDENQTVVRAVFNKYGGSNIVFDEGVYRDKNTNEILSKDQLDNNINGGFTLNTPNGRETIFNIKTEEEKKLIKDFLNTIVSETTYNDSKYAVTHINDKNTSGKHIYKENGKIVIKIGDYIEKYDNYSQFLILNNAFKTNMVGSNVSNYMELDRNPDGKQKSISRLYIEYSETVTPVSKEEHKQIKENIAGFKGWIKKENITPSKPVKTYDFLRNSGNDTEEVENLIKFDKQLKSITENNNLGILSDVVYIGTTPKAKGEEKEGGSYTRSSDKVNITKPGVELIQSKPHNAIRLAIHENIHRIIYTNKVFSSNEGRKNAKELRTTFDKFYNIYKEDNSELGKFARKFYNDYYSESDADFSNEWVAEALSNKGVTQALNQIDSGETIIINNETKPKTLLAKILEFVTNLFKNVGNIQNNNLLAKIYKILNDGVNSQSYDGSLTLFDENSNPVVIENTETTAETSPTPVEKIEQQTPPAEIKNDNTNEEEENDDEEDEDNNRTRRRKVHLDDYSQLEEIDASLTPNERKLSDYNNDKANNPYGFDSISDMDSYLDKYPHSERQAIAAALTAGEINYSCR